MTVWGKVPALLLLAAGLLSSQAAQASPMLSAHETPSGCHGHGKKTPVHPPAGYACCMAGHDSAIVQTSCVPQALLHACAELAMALPLRQDSLFPTFEIQLIPSGAPPGATPLRI